MPQGRLLVLLSAGILLNKFQVGRSWMAKMEHLRPVNVAVVPVTTSHNSSSDRQMMFHFCHSLCPLVSRHI